MSKPISKHLVDGDNLDILQEYIPTETVDLIYLTRHSIPAVLTTCYSKTK